MYRRISVPLDESELSRQALSWAIALARRARCPIDLVHVVLPPALGTELTGAAILTQPEPEIQEEEARERLAALAADLSALGVSAHPFVMTGSLPDTIVDHLEKGDSDLVVMTTHDRGRLEHLVLGSVAEAILRHIHLPTLLVHAREDRKVSQLPPESPEIRHVLVALDGSAFADEIIPHAENLAKLMKAELTLVTVLEPAMALASTFIGGEDEQVRNASSTAKESAITSEPLERAATALRERGSIVRTAALVHGQPARAIAEYAEAKSVDVVAITTHGRGALKRLVTGSVAQSLIRSTSTAVLIYRPRND